MSLSNNSMVNTLTTIHKTLDELIASTNSGGKGILNENDATYTVIARPSVVANVASFIENLNKNYERQVTLILRAYSFTANESSSVGFDLQQAFKSVTLGTKGNIDGSALIGYTTPEGLTSALGVLSKQGKVVTLTQATATTLSGQAVPLSITNDRGYVSQIQYTEGTANNPPTSTISTSSLSAGFSMVAVPKILDNGKVLIKINTNISTLNGGKDGFDTFGDGKNTVMLPNVNNRSFMQENLIKSGHTLFLASFKDRNNSSEDQGTLTAMFKLFGGKQSDSKNNNLIIVTLTPYILNADN